MPQTTNRGRPPQLAEISVALAGRILDRMIACGVTWADIERECRMPAGMARRAWRGERTFSQRRLDQMLGFLRLEGE